MTKKINRITLQDVLEVTQKGFTRIDDHLKNVEETMATKDDISRLENILIGAQDNRITRLEDDMRKLKTIVEK